MDSRFWAAVPLAVYAAVHVWWATAGGPEFDSFGESFVPGEWTPAVIAGVALAVVLAGRDRWPAVVLGWAAGGALAVYSFMFALDLASVLFGEALDWPGFLARGLGVLCAVLTMRWSVTVQRRVRGACERCGRLAHPGPGRTGRVPQWAWAGAYAAVAGATVRLVAELVAGLPWSPAEPAGIAFLAAYAAAGSLLPLALAHRWGRIWPRWTGPLAGRPVPRWVVLVPAFMVGGGLAGYFGLVGGTYIIRGDLAADYPLWWTLTVIPGYTVWGLGLLTAAIAYLAITKPPCPEYRAVRRLGSAS